MVVAMDKFIVPAIVLTLFLPSCAWLPVGVTAYTDEAKVSPFSAEYDPNPVDNSPQNQSFLGDLNVKYNVSMMTVPGWKGDIVKRIDQNMEMQALKESDYWVFVKTKDGDMGWIAKSWLQDKKKKP